MAPKYILNSRGKPKKLGTTGVAETATGYTTAPSLCHTHLYTLSRVDLLSRPPAKLDWKRTTTGFLPIAQPAPPKPTLIDDDDGFYSDWPTSLLDEYQSTNPTPSPPLSAVGHASPLVEELSRRLEELALEEQETPKPSPKDKGKAVDPREYPIPQWFP
jgi:hypothetical protein